MVSRLIVDLPDDLKKRLKSYCANNGITIHDEVLAMVCQTLDSYEEAIEEEKLQARALPGPGQQETPIETDSKQIKETDTQELMLRKALGLKEKQKQENPHFTDPLNIGL